MKENILCPFKKRTILYVHLGQYPYFFQESKYSVCKTKRNLTLKDCINSNKRHHCPENSDTHEESHETRKYKGHTDAALKEEMKSCKKCNRAN